MEGERRDGEIIMQRCEILKIDACYLRARLAGEVCAVSGRLPEVFKSTHRIQE